MKATKKEDLINFINNNFKNEELIFYDNYKLRFMWEHLAENWFIEDGRWTKS
ncbi:hypothetical protein M3664_04800 [Paenibacillus lautus]|uniref:hypothetical protein n=1 Tax=Paenibacillus lautus TaxID=1401 RepID=UPI00203E5E5F|nr:hypothetical protein [Paenibacillus lautus]MCM3257101.1 hypothetical protein [Paenibacillus lautus]